MIKSYIYQNKFSFEIPIISFLYNVHIINIKHPKFKKDQYALFIKWTSLKGWKASLRTNPNVFTTVDLSQPAISSNLQSKMCAKLREGQGAPTLTLTPGISTSTLWLIFRSANINQYQQAFLPWQSRPHTYSDQRAGSWDRELSKYDLMRIAATHIPPSHHTLFRVLLKVTL